MLNKVAVVTGGSGVLGRVFCLALAKQGYKIAIIGNNMSKAQLVVNEITHDGGIAQAFKANVTNKNELAEAANLIIQQLGSCDLLINGAGGNHPLGTTSSETCIANSKELSDSTLTDFFDLDLAGIDFVFQLNFMGSLLSSQVFAEQMLGKQHASIINISSMSGFSPLTKIPAYSAAKAALNNFTQWLAIHLAPSQIRVNAIAPGFFLTTQNYSLLKRENGEWSERAQKIIEHTPMRRLGKAEELIGTLLWLANPDSSGFVNGAVIPVDGGFNAYSGV